MKLLWFIFAICDLVHDINNYSLYHGFTKKKNEDGILSL